MRDLKTLIATDPVVRLRPPRIAAEKLPDGELRHANESDVRSVVDWISGHERDFLGADSSKDLSTVLFDWLQEGVAAFVLEVPWPDRARQVVGFINVTPIAGAPYGYEVGRVVVQPEMRRRGIGTSLFKKVVTALQASIEDPTATQVLARVHRDNAKAQGLMRCVGLGQIEGFHTAWAQPEKYLWFRWEPSPTLRLFGETMREWRTAFKWSQEELAFRLNVSRSTVNMLERGQRWVSKELLYELIRQFRLNEFQVVDLLFSLIGAKPSDVFRTIQPFSAESQENADLWLFVDAIAEASVPSFYRASVEAMTNGRRRWYFLPNDVWMRGGKDLVARFADDVGEEQLRRVLRVYEAPYPFPQFRIVFRNPTNIDAESATIDGPAGMRVPMSERLRQLLVLYVQQHVVAVEGALGRGNDLTAEHGGFRRLYPPKEDAS